MRSGDSDARWSAIDSAIVWGNGAAAPDLALARTGTRTLTLNDNAGAANPVTLLVNGTVRATRAAASSTAFNAAVDGEASPYRFAIQADGKLEWGPGGAAQDVSLYRSAADLLTTDDELEVGAAGGKDTLRLTSTGTDTGITLGGDTNLYRSAANSLATDDALAVGAGLTVTGDVDVTDEYRIGGRNRIIPARIEGFMADNLPTSQASTIMGRFAVGNTGGFQARPIAGRIGRVVGAMWRTSTAVTAGTLTIYANIGGTDYSIGTITSGSSGSLTMATPENFSAAQGVGANYSTNASWTQTTLDVCVDLLVEFAVVA
jgi:hypothetical protein